MSNTCVYCAQGDPAPKYGFRAHCRVCHREYLAPFPGHGIDIESAQSDHSSVSKLALPPRPRPTVPQSTMEFD